MWAPDALMDPPVPVVGAAARVDVEFLANAVDFPLQVAIFQLRQWMDPSTLQEEIPDDESAEMRRVRNAAANPKRRIERDRANNEHEVLGRNRKDEIEENRPLGKIHRVCEQQSVDRP